MAKSTNNNNKSRSINKDRAGAKLHPTQPLNSGAPGKQHLNKRVGGKDRLERTPARPTPFVDALAASMNDASWYAANPQLLADAASISYNNPVGAKISVLDVQHTNYPSIPGIMALMTDIGPGVSEDVQSPINIAARNIYAFVRHVNSGHANYDPADLMMYLLALDSAYSCVAWMRRIYGELMVSSQYNRYLPEANIYSENLNFYNFSMHIADLRYFINVVQVKLGSFVIPREFSYFTRHMWLFSNEYIDEANQKAQIYKFVPSGFWQYNELDGAGRLDWRSLSLVTTFEELVDYVNSLINAIAASEDCGIISGDLLKAFGDSGIWKMDALMEDYCVLPVPNPEVVAQIQNSTIIGGVRTEESNHITQEVGFDPVVGGAIIHKPAYVVAAYYDSYGHPFSCDRMLSVDDPEPNPAITMVSTRLTVFGDVDRDSHILTITECGDSIISAARVIYRNEDGEFTSAMLPGYVMECNDIATLRSWLNYTALVHCFDNHPALMCVGKLNDEEHLYSYLFDINNYTFVSREVMHKMHMTALLSEFNVPIMGMFSSKVTK